MTFFIIGHQGKSEVYQTWDLELDESTMVDLAWLYIRMIVNSADEEEAAEPTCCVNEIETCINQALVRQSASKEAPCEKTVMKANAPCMVSSTWWEVVGFFTVELLST